MSAVSDNAEALEHNILFGGLFKSRGFLDLGSLTTPESRTFAFGAGFKEDRVSPESAQLFKTARVEMLSVDGRARLDEAMTELLDFRVTGR